MGQRHRSFQVTFFATTGEKRRRSNGLYAVVNAYCLLIWRLSLNLACFKRTAKLATLVNLSTVAKVNSNTEFVRKIRDSMPKSPVPDTHPTEGTFFAVPKESASFVGGSYSCRGETGPSGDVQSCRHCSTRRRCCDT